MKYRKSKHYPSIGPFVKCALFGAFLLGVSFPAGLAKAQEDAAEGSSAPEENIEATAESEDVADAPEESTDEGMPDDNSLKSTPSLDLDDKGEDPFAFEDEEGIDDFQKSSQELENEFRKGAFQAALNKVLPLRPDEIRTLLEHYDRTIESTELPVHPNPRAETVVQNVSLDPGSPPLVIKLAFGYVTTVSLLDSSGAPWQIEDMSWVGEFNVMADTAQERTHIFRISPESDFSHGNLSVRMIGLDTPIVFTLETNRDFVYYRFDAVLPGNGPNATAPLIQPGVTLAAGDVDMSAALSGVTPKDAVKLSVAGVDGRTSAFKYNNYTYVRTPLTLLSPGWESSVTSADGTKVYALVDAPVLLLSDKGRMVRAYLSEREELLDE